MPVPLTAPDHEGQLQAGTTAPSGALIDGSHYRGRHPNDTVKQTLRVTSTVDPTPRIRPSVLGPQPAVPDGGSVSVGPSKGPGSGRQGRSEPGRSADHRIGTRPPSPPPRADPPGGALVGVLLLVAYYLLLLNKPEDIGVLLLGGAWWSPGRSGRS